MTRDSNFRKTGKKILTPLKGQFSKNVDLKSTSINLYEEQRSIITEFEAVVNEQRNVLGKRPTNRSEIIRYAIHNLSNKDIKLLANANY